MSGALQSFGKRWDDHPIISKLYNDAWVRPEETLAHKRKSGGRQLLVKCPHRENNKRMYLRYSHDQQPLRCTAACSVVVAKPLLNLDTTK